MDDDEDCKIVEELQSSREEFEIIESKDKEEKNGFLNNQERISKQCQELVEKSSEMQELLENVEGPEGGSNQKSKKVLIDINFRNKKTYFAFHEEFIDIIKKYYKEKLDDLDFCDDTFNNRICVSEKIVKKSDSFLIDTTPNIDFNKSLLESSPRYTSFSKTVLSNIIDLEEEKSLSTSSNSNRCFNCDKGTHSLRECPEPRNFNKIRKARNEFNRKELRYHDDNDEISNLIPGQLSEDLKVALGLTDNQLPLHIYKMRNFGYPPSWLEEAKVYYSGLQILNDKIDVQEDGVRGSFKYDVQRIYEFPGFNVYPTEQYVDKHRLLNLPPMLHKQSKEEFISTLGDFVINGYKKRKLRETISINDTSTNVDDTEMEIENEENKNENDDYDSKNSPEDGELSSNDEELQIERNKLLTELSSMNDSQNQKNFKEENQKEDSFFDNIPKKNTDREEKSQDHGRVETTIFGCPVLPSFSPFESLPSGEKFQEGVCDVIAFENLAESTGKYEKMKGLIKKVRVVLKENQKEWHQ